MTPADVPPGVRRICEAMVSTAVARCEREGIALEDFYAAIMAEKAAVPGTTVSDLFARVFRRLARN